jgi:phosphonate transport system ATP-binding protein
MRAFRLLSAISKTKFFYRFDRALSSYNNARAGKEKNMISFRNVTKVYPNGVVGLRHVTLDIQQGEFVAIIGLSGAGKSTLIRTINRMIEITEGELVVDDVDVSKLKGKALRLFRRRIGMIFQSFNLITRSTAIKNVLTSLVPDMPWYKTLFGIYSKAQKIASLEALDKVGILEKAYTRCDQLSGGQQQRVALARTLNQKPTIILADEPVAALDPITAKMVMGDFAKINEETNITILINIHHVDLALDYAKRLIGIRDGEIVYDGPVKNVTQEILDEIYKGKDIPKSEQADVQG